MTTTTTTKSYGYTAPAMGRKMGRCFAALVRHPDGKVCLIGKFKTREEAEKRAAKAGR